MRNLILSCASTGALLLLVGCSSGTPSIGDRVTQSVAAISIEPPAPMLDGTTQTLSARVINGTGGVAWSVVDGGGAITSAGVFTAPNKAGTVTVKATSINDLGVSNTVRVEVHQVSVAVTPKAASISHSGRVPLTATVGGAVTEATTVHWEPTGGTVTNGVYTPPAQDGIYFVRAVSDGDSRRYDEAVVTVGPVLDDGVNVFVSPGAIRLPYNTTQQFTAAVFGTANPAVDWSATGGTISAAGLYTANEAGSWEVRATSKANPTKSATAKVDVYTSLSNVTLVVSPKSAAIAKGSSIQLKAVVSGTTDTSVDWSATGGTVSADGLFTGSEVGQWEITATSRADATKSASASIRVAAPNAPTAQLTANTTSVIAGQSVALVPVFTNGSGVMTNGAVNTPVTSGQIYTVTPPGAAGSSVGYLLVVTSPDGQTATASVQITLK